MVDLWKHTMIPKNLPHSFSNLFGLMSSLGPPSVFLTPIIFLHHCPYPHNLTFVLSGILLEHHTASLSAATSDPVVSMRLYHSTPFQPCGLSHHFNPMLSYYMVLSHRQLLATGLISSISFH